jgi:hypothetical protein
VTTDLTATDYEQASHGRPLSFDSHFFCVCLAVLKLSKRKFSFAALLALKTKLSILCGSRFTVTALLLLAQSVCPQSFLAFGANITIFMYEYFFYIYEYY